MARAAVGEREGDLLVVEEAAGDVAVDLERAPVEGAVALAGGGPAEGGQLGGQDPAAVRVAECGGRPGRPARSGPLAGLWLAGRGRAGRAGRPGPRAAGPGRGRAASGSCRRRRGGWVGRARSRRCRASRRGRGRGVGGCRARSGRTSGASHRPPWPPAGRGAAGPPCVRAGGGRPGRRGRRCRARRRRCRWPGRGWPGASAATSARAGPGRWWRRGCRGGPGDAWPAGHRPAPRRQEQARLAPPELGRGQWTG